MSAVLPFLFGVAALAGPPAPPGGLPLVVVNEVLADPAPGDDGDANCDGVRDSGDDEFVEIVNLGGEPADLTGWEIYDDAGGVPQHVFGALVLEPGAAVVVFGGGTPTFDGSSWSAEPHCVELPPDVHVETASSGSLSLGSLDLVELKTADGPVVDLVEWDGDGPDGDGTPEGDDNTSLVRDPELDPLADFVKHDEIAPDGRRQSPGTLIDGSPFCSTAYYADVDGDGYGDPDLVEVACGRPAGFADNGDDCDDTNDHVHPGALEVCDGVLGDCDLRPGDVPSDEVDDDGDGFVECVFRPGDWVGAGPEPLGGGDCDDHDDDVYPGAPNICDGEVDDCADPVLTPDEIDDDGDGFVECSLDGWEGDPGVVGGGDCDDTNDRVYPGAVELCDGVANGCPADDVPPDEVDDDGDGFVECEGHGDVPWRGDPGVVGGGDCDDDPEFGALTFPGADERCNGVVDNCALVGLPHDEADLDGDGRVVCAIDPAGWRGDLGVVGGSDCDDTDPTVFPDAPPLCDGQVNACGEVLGPDEVDDDGDGYVDCDEDPGGWDVFAPFHLGGGDCDDADVAVFPGAIERCDGVLTDCDAAPLPADETDDDGDGYVACRVDGGGWLGPEVPVGGGDCDDGDAARHPGAVERCNGRIDDCDAETLPDDEADRDGDGVVVCAEDPGGWLGPEVAFGDCDDTDPSVRPGAPEVCDGLDNDCDGVVGDDEIDDDRDGFVVCAIDAGGWDDDPTRPVGGDDCDDDAVTVFPGAVELCDGRVNDCDAVALRADEMDDDGDGYVECPIDPGGWFGDPLVVGGGDCDDTDPTARPDGVELCDGQNNSCGGGPVPADEVDDDGDGFVECAYDPAAPWAGDVRPLGGGDCDDTGPDAATVYPGALERCDGIVNACGEALPSDEQDPDEDAWVACAIDLGGWDGPRVPSGGDDCAPLDGTVYPGAPALCDGLINDCTDDALDPGEHDDDGDGFVECALDAGGWDGDDAPFLVLGGDDCDDTNDTVYPGALLRLCDGVINDCGPELAADEVDDDGDGFVECTIAPTGWAGDVPKAGGDCDDTRETVFPGAPDRCDGAINDCADDALDPAEVDDDGDGFVECDVDAAGWAGGLGVLGGGDCRDAPLHVDPRSAQFHPTAPELCDGLDNQDCDALGLPADEVDHDGDGFVECDIVPDGWLGDIRVFDGLDCDDTDNTVYPDAPFRCDGVANDCTAPELDPREVDRDGDRYVECTLDVGGWDGSPFVLGGQDCAPDDPLVHPGAIELCDGVANDCRLDGVVPADELDADGDGYLACDGERGGDCDPHDPAVYPGAVEACDGKDTDCDGALGDDELDGDGDGFGACVDCDDGDPAVFPGADERCDGRDGDCDGVLPDDERDGDGDHFVGCEVDAWPWPDPAVWGGGDCDDAEPTVHPGALERCDGLDNDCVDGPGAREVDPDGDGVLDCELDCAPVEVCNGIDDTCDGALSPDEVDVDGDGYVACGVDGWLGAPEVVGGGDCAPLDPEVHPGVADEGCDGLDTDCDGALDPAEDDPDGDLWVACYPGDGWRGGPLIGGGDCGPDDARVHPLAVELCDGVDSDCDGVLPDDERDLDLDGAPDCVGDGPDLDGDGYPLGVDCDDLDADVSPGHPEVLDGLDTDCDGFLEAGEADADRDGWLAAPSEDDLAPWRGAPFVGVGDCDDADGAVHPSAPERCNGRGDACGPVPVDETDDDGDGYVECAPVEPWLGGPIRGGGDCDDADAAVHPGADEVDDLKDTDCDGVLLPAESDLDGDGVPAAVDCDDTRGWVYPGAPERCDGLIGDCGPSLPDGEADLDGDGFVRCTLDAIGWHGDPVWGGDDCDDADGAVFPGAPERCNGIGDACGPVPADEADVDGDGFAACADDDSPWLGDPVKSPGDCDDRSWDVNPGVEERCNGRDDDCDGALGPLELDADGDGFTGCANDCDDTDPAIHPGAAEVCDGVDTDCDREGDAGLDGDLDRLTCLEELAAGSSDDFPDTDRDGLTDYEEVYIYDSSPILEDTDGDTIVDPIEYADWRADALDVDGDGLKNAADPDDDGDGLSTEVEAAAGCVPGIEDAYAADDDIDGVPTLDEVTWGSDPCAADTDGDGYDDGAEWYAEVVVGGCGPAGGVRFAELTFDEVTLRDVWVDCDEDLCAAFGLDRDRDAPWDRDCDGRINAVDLDDDGDGIPTTLERDRDEDCGGSDRVPAFLDYDADGDGIADVEESPVDGDDTGALPDGPFRCGEAPEPEVDTACVDCGADDEPGEYSLRGCAVGGGPVGPAVWLALLALGLRRSGRPRTPHRRANTCSSSAGGTTSS